MIASLLSEDVYSMFCLSAAMRVLLPENAIADTSNPEVTALEKKEQAKAWIGAIIGGLCIWLSNLAIKKYEEINCEAMSEPLKKLSR